MKHSEGGVQGSGAASGKDGRLCSLFYMMSCEPMDAAGTVSEEAHAFGLLRKAELVPDFLP